MPEGPERPRKWTTRGRAAPSSHKLLRETGKLRACMSRCTTMSTSARFTHMQVSWPELGEQICPHQDHEPPNTIASGKGHAPPVNHQPPVRPTSRKRRICEGAQRAGGRLLLAPDALQARQPICSCLTLHPAQDRCSLRCSVQDVPSLVQPKILPAQGETSSRLRHWVRCLLSSAAAGCHTPPAATNNVCLPQPAQDGSSCEIADGQKHCDTATFVGNMLSSSIRQSL